MTASSKIFWFFAVCLALKMVMPSTATEQPVKETVKYGKEEQCKTSKWYTVYWQYDGRIFRKDTVQCYNNLVIRSEPR